MSYDPIPTIRREADAFLAAARRGLEPRVPGCPDWTVPSHPNFDNASMSNFGCGVNSNLAAMIANPEDLIHGREGSGVNDTSTGAKAVIFYRSTPPSGTKGLQEINTKEGK